MTRKEVNLELNDDAWLLGMGIIGIIPGPLLPMGGNVCVTVYRNINDASPCKWMINIRMRYYKDDKVRHSSDIRGTENWMAMEATDEQMKLIAKKLLHFVSFTYNRKQGEDIPNPEWLVIEGKVTKLAEIAQDKDKCPEWLDVEMYPNQKGEAKEPKKQEPSDPKDYEDD